MPIPYTNLSVESRLQVWRHLCLRKLGEVELNGRQIKNAIKTAESQAKFDGAQPDLERLLRSARLQLGFSEKLRSYSGPDYTAPGSSRQGSEMYHIYA